MHRCLCDEKSRANLLLRFGSISFWSGSTTVCFYLMNSEGEVHTALAFAVPLVVIVFNQVFLQQLNWDINDANREFVDKGVFDYGKFRFRIGLGCALPSALFWIVQGEGTPAGGDRLPPMQTQCYRWQSCSNNGLGSLQYG